MATINPYLHFSGNAEDAFNFYKSVFGGEFGGLHRFADMPSDPSNTECPELSESDKAKIMHVSLPIGNGNALMGSDCPDSMAAQSIVGTNFSISINAESKEEAGKLFNGLSEGGSVTMPLADTFWGAYFGMFTDKFGIQWMVNHENNSHK